MAECEECGSQRVRPARVEGVEVEVCALCDHVQGDAARVARVHERREAVERGFHRAIYPLVKALEGVPTFRVEAAEAGRPESGEYPFVFLRLRPEGLADLERLLTSLEMANARTRRRWVVECALQRGLLFILRPRFWKAVQAITAADIEEARADLPLLAQALARDVGLTWWGREGPTRRGP
jgi:hypothetical protein